MKNMFFLLLIIITVNVSANNIYINNYKGSIKKVIITKETNNLTIWDKLIENFDKNRNILSEITYRENNLFFESYYFYDNNRLIKEEHNRRHPNSILESVIEYIYDKNGNLIESYNYNIYNKNKKLEKASIFKYKLDNKKRIIEKIIISLSPIPKDIVVDQNRTVYKYNDKNQIIEEQYYFNNIFRRNTKYSFNDNNELINEQYFNVDGTLSTNINYSYLEKDNNNNYLNQMAEYSYYKLDSTNTNIKYLEDLRKKEFIYEYYEN